MFVAQREGRVGVARGNAVVTDGAELVVTRQHEMDGEFAFALVDHYEPTRANTSWTRPGRFLNRASQVRSLPGAPRRVHVQPLHPDTDDSPGNTTGAAE